MDRTFFQLGALISGLAVAAGAFGTHQLRGKVEPRMLEIFETAARYQMYHGLALLAVAWACTRWQGTTLTTAGWLFVAGTVIFCGSLYTMTFTGIRWLGAITPIGGACWILAWALLAWGVRGVK